MAASLSTRDLFKVVTIDRVRKTRTDIQLKDPEGDSIPIEETVEKLTEYILDKVKDPESNSCKQQIMPLMAQAMVAGMIKLLGPGEATLLLSDSIIRNSLMYMTTMSFYLLKLIQQKNIKIFSEDFILSTEELEMMEKTSKISDLTMKFASMGGDPKEFLGELLKRGMVTKEELSDMGAGDFSVEEVPVDQTKTN